MVEDLKSLGKNEHGNIWAHWNFPEFIKHQRGLGWIILMAILSLGLIIWAFWTANILFAFIIIIIAIIVILQAKREPLEVKFQITEDGLGVGSKFYEWKRIENFWVIYKPPEIKKLYFKLNGILPPSLSISLEKQNPIKIREILLRYCLEDLEKDDESFSDFLGRSLKI